MIYPYISMIYPMNNQHVWEITSYLDVLPPTSTILPKRPRKKRRLQPWELMTRHSKLQQPRNGEGRISTTNNWEGEGIGCRYHTIQQGKQHILPEKAKVDK